MDSTYIALLITCLVAVLIPFSIFLYKRYFVGGFLTISLKFNQGISSPSVVIKPKIDLDGFLIRDESVIRHHLEWLYDLTITNNSHHAAYFPKILYKNDLYPNITIDELDEMLPIEANKSVTIKIKFFEVSDTLPTMRKRTTKAPAEFSSLKLMLEYYNNDQIRFYTLYDNSDFSNISSRRKPRF